MIKLTKKQDANIFSEVYWVLLARSKDTGSRPALTMLHAEASGLDIRITCTDGYRLHRAEDMGDMFEPGLYEVVKFTKSEIFLARHEGGAVYPDINPMIPDPERYNFNLNLQVHTISTAQSIAYSRLIRELPDDRTIDFSYFKDTMSRPLSYPEVAPVNSYSTVVLRDKNLYALIMYVRIQD